MPISTITSKSISGVIAAGTIRSATGVIIQFPNIPSWAKRVSIILSGVSTNGTDALLIQLGTRFGVVTTGYNSTVSGPTTSSNGFLLTFANSNEDLCSGIATIVNIGGNQWVSTSVVKRSTTQIYYAAGNASLPSALTTAYLTTTQGQNSFDTGSVNFYYE